MIVYELLIILLPLIIGYCFRITHITLFKIINNVINYIIYIILFFMGIILANSDNINNLPSIFIYAFLFFVFSVGANIIILSISNYFYKWHLTFHYQNALFKLSMLRDSLQMSGILLVGFLVGLTHWSGFIWASKASEITLTFLLFLIGIQLRGSHITLRQLILNQRGFFIAIMVIASSLAGGTAAALLLNIPLNYGLAITSANGWYSLSSIMLNKTLGPIWGAIGFFNDLLRELVALFFIPLLARNNATCALGISGATSMDFTLPILQRCAGIEIVPAAIVHGFIVSLCAPILIAIFTA